MSLKKILLLLLLFPFLWIDFLYVKKTNAIVPFYNIPDKNELEKESLSIGKSAYQLLYFGQIKEALNLAKLAITINDKDETLWAILAEAQVANNLNSKALESINEGKKINPLMSELYFAESSIFLSDKNYKRAKKSIIKGLEIQPENVTARFQLGNIYLIEEKFNKAIKSFNEAINFKKDFWQALNNKGLAYFELDNLDLSIKYFEEAIKFEENTEPMLGLAASIQNENKQRAIELTKKALLKDPKYVSKSYRKEQLWGTKIQKATNELFRIKELKEDIFYAKQYLK